MCSSMNASSCSRSSWVRASYANSMSALLQRGDSGGDEGFHGRTDRVEPLPDGLALGVAEVDALQDHGELEGGEAEVEAHGRQVAPAPRAVQLDGLGLGQEAGCARHVRDARVERPEPAV